MPDPGFIAPIMAHGPADARELLARLGLDLPTARYQAIDRCTEPGCRCDDTAGVILYDGPDRTAAEEALRQARYPDPEIVRREGCEHSWHDCGTRDGRRVVACQNCGEERRE